MADDAALQELLDELAKTRGADFRGYKPASLQRRLRKRMAQLNLNSYQDYLAHVRSDGEEINHLISVVLINVTEFFRDAPAWDVLRERALPHLLGRMQPGDSFRAWCAGCATGEEVYSLAILLAEHFGARLSEFDVKIYATDHDDDALNAARRGEYATERLRRVRPEWREKYFAGPGPVVRVQRELRRLAIFGRSNLASDAPISHVQLLVCRNVLIYFDVALQKQVIEKFRYGLDDGGILFLGRSESQLRDYGNFRPIDSKWRIFQCGKPSREREEPPMAFSDEKKVEQFSLLQRHLLESLHSGVVVLDEKNIITTVNPAALDIWGAEGAPLVGNRVMDTILAERCPQLTQYIEQSIRSQSPNPLPFECKIFLGAEERFLRITLRPLLGNDALRTGTLIYGEDITPHEKLRSTVEELETTAEELHSANEELETTNEELQSTNEELETTNEELQSTNEELETTNEELHSLNEELETTNDELEQRTRDLEEVSARYAETLAQMPSPLMVVSDAAEIQLWNSAAERLFNLAAKGVVGLKLEQLPFPARFRKVLVQRHQTVLRTQQPSHLRGVQIKLDSFADALDIRFLPLSAAWRRGVLIMFEPQSAARGKGDRNPKGALPAVRSAGKSAGKKSAGTRRNSRTKNGK